MKSLRTILLWIAAVQLCGLLPVSAHAANAETEPAEIRVRGLGLLGNREMRLGISRLWGSEPPAALSSTELEDAGLFIASSLSARGYLRPRIEVEVSGPEDETDRFELDLTMQTPPPRGISARKAVFRVDKGVRYFLRSVDVRGLEAIPTAAAQDFFFTDVALIVGKGARAYSPSRVQRSADAIESTLRQQGFGQAVARITDTQQNHRTGEVSIVVVVEEGPRWVLEKIEFDVDGTNLPELEPLGSREGVAWSVFRGQDLAEEVRQLYYRRGYPDVRVRLETKPQPVVGGERRVHVLAHVTTGGHVSVGEIRFRGHERTKEKILRRRVEIEEGAVLNPLKLERARYRLGSLGVFRSVELTYEPSEGPVRDPVFILRELQPLEVHLMAGYGSYELLRGGVEVTQLNVFGRAHRARLELVQTFKSSRGEYTYSVPELLGEEVDGTLRLFGLQREERAFVRQEYGGTVMLSRRVPFLDAEGTLGYTYQSLQNQDNELATRDEDLRQLSVASIDITLASEGRDNPLRPRRGYRWFTQAELAATHLGGELNYQRLEFGGSYHTGWGRGRWIHAGLTHGVILTLGSSDQLLPVNKRFYPGGESSIRGFAEGDASPREGDRYIGAKTYTLVNLELEQALTGTWSLVLFTDLLGTSTTLSSYPSAEEFITVGLGLRYQTLIGPIRLEYGHNVVKRDDDPDGALHLSVGFPF